MIAFDDKFEWIVDMKKADDKEKLQKLISGIQLGGGTSIYPAVEQAYQAQLKSNAQIKHIILLTDGQDGFREYDDLIKKLNDKKITLSTVSVGNDSDVGMLEILAKAGKGRYYHTDINTDIPRIFAKEVYLSINEYLNNREFAPQLNNSHPIINEIIADKTIPSLLGYVASTPKETANVLLTSDKDDPILSVWQCGLGKTVAWNSDITGEWSANYTGWDKNIKLWQNIINWTVQEYNDEGRYANVSVEGNKALIEYNTKNEDTDAKVTAISIDEEGNKETIELSPILPGKYLGTVKMTKQGFYTLNIREEKDGENIGFVNSGAVLQYSPEYKYYEENKLLENLVEDVNGQIINNPSDVFKGNIEDVKSLIDLTTFLLVLALCLFLLDVANRKLNIPYEKYLAKLGIERIEFRNQLINKQEVKKIITEEKEKKETKITDEKQEKVKQKKTIKEIKKSTIDTSALLKKKENRS